MKIIYLIITLYVVLKTLSFSIYMYKKSNYFSFSACVVLSLITIMLASFYII